MQLLSLSSNAKARLVLIVLFSGLCAAIIGAPLLAASSYSGSASLFYLAFAAVCHQDAERSFQLLGTPWAVCQRCSGIYFGLFLALLLSAKFYRRLHASLSVRRCWVLFASTPIVVDGTASLLRIWDGLPATRFATGLLFGAMLATLLVPGITELIENQPRRQEAATEGGTP